MIPKEAIEAACRARNPSWSHWLEDSRTMEREKMSAALTAAFAAMSEPVAFRWKYFSDGDWAYGDNDPKGFRFGVPEIFGPLYAAPQPAAVKVKPLEWYDTTERNAYGQFLRMAVTVFGSYRILRGSQGKFEVYFGTSPFSGAMDALEKAEDWGQSNYEARILSTLMSAPDLASENERLRAALERQGDNMAFVINHATLPGQWLIKFEAELLEDRAALERT